MFAHDPVNYGLDRLFDEPCKPMRPLAFAFGFAFTFAFAFAFAWALLVP